MIDNYVTIIGAASKLQRKPETDLNPAHNKNLYSNTAGRYHVPNEARRLSKVGNFGHEDFL